MSLAHSHLPFIALAQHRMHDLAVAAQVAAIAPPQPTCRQGPQRKPTRPQRLLRMLQLLALLFLHLLLLLALLLLALLLLALLLLWPACTWSQHLGWRWQVQAVHLGRGLGALRGLSGGRPYLRGRPLLRELIHGLRMQHLRPCLLHWRGLVGRGEAVQWLGCLPGLSGQRLAASHAQRAACAGRARHGAQGVRGAKGGWGVWGSHSLMRNPVYRAPTSSSQSSKL